MKTNKKKAIRMGLAVTAAALFWGGMYLLFGSDAAQKMEWNQVKDYAPILRYARRWTKLWLKPGTYLLLLQQPRTC